MVTVSLWHTFPRHFLLKISNPVDLEWYLGLDCSSTKTPVMRTFWESTACTLVKVILTNCLQYTATTAKPRWASGMILSATKFTALMEPHSIPTSRRFVEFSERRSDRTYNDIFLEWYLVVLQWSVVQSDPPGLWEGYKTGGSARTEICSPRRCFYVVKEISRVSFQLRLTKRLITEHAKLLILTF